jgi:hypothetical protein
VVHIDEKSAQKEEEPADSSPPRYTEAIIYGKAVGMTDNELIDLLRKPPKSVVALRTKGSFQEFFRGMESKRIIKLLETAYNEIENPKERSLKVNKRMDLLREVLL